MWTPNLPKLEHPPLTSLEPVDVLYDFDGPRIFTFLDTDKELNLAYWSDEQGDCWRYVVVPTTQSIVQALNVGQISVWDALNQPRCWICDTDLSGDVTAVYRVDFESIPEDSLPSPSAMLLSSLQPQWQDLEGRIRELDKDHLSFELREIESDSPITQRFVFDQELLEVVFRAFQEDRRVRVAAKPFPVRNAIYALALSNVSTEEPESGSSK